MVEVDQEVEVIEIMGIEEDHLNQEVVADEMIEEMVIDKIDQGKNLKIIIEIITKN